MRSATGSWQRSADGSKLHVILDRYFDEGERNRSLLGTELTNFHRTLSTYVRAYRKCGFAIEDLIEPTVDPADVAHYPDLEDELRVPNFIIFVLKKENRPHDAEIESVDSFAGISKSAFLSNGPLTQLFRNGIGEGLPTTRNLTVDECPVPQQFSPTTVQVRAFLVVNLSINLDGK
jgi:hypothetical protein